MKLTYLSILLLLLSLNAYPQDAIHMQVSDGNSNLAVPFVNIVSNSTFLASTDSAGKALVTLPAGSHKISFVLTGYKRLDTTITIPSPKNVNITLVPEAEDLAEVTIVSSTRSNQNIESSPLKVEVLGKEEMSEEAGIKPGNIASILGDVSGVQIQQSSATSGNSNVRIQGLDGRYTQILQDGMPLYDGFSGGFGILTIPPLDLKQIELIKGSASTLYGGGAIGGLVNLISKRPAYNQEADALINYTTLNEANVNAFAAKRNDKLGYTIFAGYTRQQATDVNKDDLSDVPKTNSFLIHPKLFYYPTAKTTIALGYSGSFDKRRGGDMLVLQNKADNSHQYYESNNSQRHTGEYLVEHYYTTNAKVTLKGNISNFDRLTNTNFYSLKGNQTSYYSEASGNLPIGKSDLIVGINIVGDTYKTINPDTASLKSLANTTVGAFGQYSLHIKGHTTVEAGLRFDRHSRYGIFALPRVAAFHKFGDHWAVRAGFGMGYKTPNPLVPQNIEYNVLDILPVSSLVKPEISYGYNAEVNYKKEWGKGNSLFINQAFFLTQVNRPIVFETNTGNKVDMVNATKPIVSRGFDTYVKLILHSWELYAGYTYTDARLTYLPGNTFVPLTPRNRWAFVLVKEIENAWRLGLEGSHTGTQYRYDRSSTPGYLFIAAMIQRQIGKHAFVVLNGENLLDYRMSKVESLYNGSIQNPAFKPLWAPIDGRVINLSLRWKL
ncbi:MAG: TonB-dependent receptor [Bacteroidetes bacterium]|nr:TonB-dependent receptor [Bacteroidota bacterium]